MSTETTANPAEDAGASTPAPDAGANGGAPEITDEEFNALNTVEVPDEDAGAEAKEPTGEGDPEGKTAPTGGDDDLVEIELDNGLKVKIPKAAEAGYLRDRDYRQKTMALGEERRALETERQTWQQTQEESRAALPHEYAKVAIVEHSVATAQADVTELEKIDWATWRAQTLNLADDDPNKVQYKQYRAAYDAARETLTDAQRALTAAKEDLSAKEQDRLSKQQEAREAHLATARQETGSALKAEGWTEQTFADVASFAVTEFGVDPQELGEVVDPRTWKMAREVMTSRAEIARLNGLLKQKTTADTNVQAQASRPAEPAKGNAQPTRVRDDVATDTWMARRNAQVAAKRKSAAR